MRLLTNSPYTHNNKNIHIRYCIHTYYLYVLYTIHIPSVFLNHESITNMAAVIKGGLSEKIPHRTVFKNFHSYRDSFQSYEKFGQDYLITDHLCKEK